MNQGYKGFVGMVVVCAVVVLLAALIAAFVMRM